jgi:hypothetical protein
VTALYKYWSVGSEATYLCLCQSSHSKATVARSLLHYLCSQLPHSCSTLLLILEINLVHVVKQQLLYKRRVNFTLLIAATCFSFILSSSFTFWTLFLYLKIMFLIWISCVLWMRCWLWIVNWRRCGNMRPWHISEYYDETFLQGWM